MTIHKKQKVRKLEINLSGPDGNAYALMAYAKNIGKQLKMTEAEITAIIDEMMSDNYDHLVAVFDHNFGDYVDIYES